MVGARFAGLMCESVKLTDGAEFRKFLGIGGLPRVFSPDELPSRITLHVHEDLQIWKRYREWQDDLAPKCNFSPQGIANAHERRRRFTLFSLFYLFDFRSHAPGEIFRECFGRLSVAWFTDVVGPAAPPQYYRWLIEHDGPWQRTWGFTVAQLLGRSESHLEMLREIDSKKMRSFQRKLDRELVRGVMED